LFGSISLMKQTLCIIIILSGCPVAQRFIGLFDLKTFNLTSLAMILTLFLSVAAQAAEDAAAPDVETLMTPQDYQASGLDKLSDAERAHLSEWVERYREGAVQGPVVQKPPSKQTEEEREADTDYEVVANVIPAFRGWNGKTIFKLDNGQVWQQRMRGTSFLYSGTSSEVMVSKNMFGGFVLEHVESGRSIGVKRVD
jgi:hypothetical protein